MFFILIIQKLFGTRSEFWVCMPTAQVRACSYPCWRRQWRSRPRWSWRPWSVLSQRPVSAWAASQSSGGLHARILRAWGVPAASLSPWDEAANLAWCHRIRGYTAKECVTLSVHSCCFLLYHSRTGVWLMSKQGLSGFLSLGILRPSVWVCGQVTEGKFGMTARFSK